MKQLAGNIICKKVSAEYDVYFDMALTMLEEIMYHNERNEKTVMIVPVGPTDQYHILAEMINRLNISLKNVHFFNMDEYMINEYETVKADDPLSFYARMEREFYSKVREDLVMPKSQRHFPVPGKEKEYDMLIEELGGVDLCLGGLGINGHVAFNEPPEANEEVSADEFATLGTRVLPISRETKTINAFGYNKGDLKGMPEWCITIGMKQILSSRKIYIALNRPWQVGPFKHALLSEQTSAVPASLLRRCSNVTFCGYKDVMDNVLP